MSSRNPFATFKVVAVTVMAILLSGYARAQYSPPSNLYSAVPVNYVRIWEASSPGLDANSIMAQPVTAARQVTQYFDGLGRPVQTVAKQASPLQSDMVTPVLYDPFGREQYRFMPFTSVVAQSGDVTNDGNFKPDAFQQGAAFNQGQFPGENYYYSQTQFEASPLNRTMTVSPPGISWVGSGRNASTQYLVNGSNDSVQVWNIALTAGALPINAGQYEAGQLDKLATVDEQGHQLVEYRDKDGLVLLKKVQFADNPGTAHVGWLCTYYVYDDLNNLRFVISPRAAEIINVAGPWSVPQAVADELCFRYEYDARNRMIVKKVPGAGELDMVYDARDRLVMSQDAQLQAQHKWQYMVYDDLNRSTASGLLTDPANYNHPAYHQGLAAGSTAYPNLTAYSVEQMLQTYYDAYASLAGLPGSMAGGIAVNGSFFNLTYNSAPLYAVPVAAYPISRGLTTGIVAKVVGTSFSYVYSETFYDDRGRAIQTFSSNYSGGIDTMTTQYNFAGKILRVLVGHAKANNTAQHHRVLTKISYDPNFRVTAILKNIDQAPTDQSIASMQYNEVGQLQSKTIGNNLDNLVYDYNVRGWTTGINKAYLDGTAHNYFGMQLGYDKGVAGPQPTQVAQFTGNIDGVVWKSAGDGIRRKFDFKYDNANHITRAEYNKNSSGDAWDVNTENYSMWGFDADNSYGIKYDANGNLMMMILGGQKGIGSPQTINALRYTYMSNSNKLRQVTDDDNDPNTTLGNFHYNSATKTDTDYGYDANGNLLLDKNKTIDKITYNYLNLPQLVHMNGKGNILYTYDAAGNKLQKQVIDSVSGLATTTLYLGGFQYQRRTPMATPSGGVDTLQFVGHEEGRARWAFHKYTTGDSAYAWEYDFMEKDHLGNTRVLLTQQRDTANYMCTMEPEYRTMEDALFTGVDHSVYTRPAWMPPSPHGPSSNNTIALVDGSSYQVGPAKLLKVMSGDTVVLGVDAWVTNGAVTGQTPSSTLVLNGLANGLVSMTGPTHGSYADLIGATSPVAAAVTSFLAAKEPTPATLPKAYLNWMLLDNHMNYVSGQSGAIPVTGTNAWCSLATSLPLTTSGYLYIWVSNESHWVMFYDNLSIEHIQGPMLEEDHYYPFGMQMAGLCDKALKSNYVQNRYKFKGKEEQRQEFNDGSGLEWLDFGARMYDDQIGRWHLPDPLAEKYNDASPYAFVKNNPINNIEIDGRWFNKKNEKRAAKIGAAIDKRIGKIEKQIASLQKGGKDIGDRRERIDELNKSKGDIQNMRDDKANEYRYEGVGKNPGPVTTPEGESGHVIVMHTENSMGSKLHEGRHGGELARGETNFKKDDKGNWLGGNLYGVNDEISAYRAQYAYSGRLDFIEYFNPDVLQGVQYLTEFPKIVSDHTLSRTNINDINASLINSMADKKGFTLERIYSKQFVNETEWNKN